MTSPSCMLCHANQADVVIVHCEGGGHAICSMCFKEVITAPVAKDDPSLGCPAEGGCSSYLSDSNARLLLSPYPELARQRILLKRGLATLPNFLGCAFCDFGIEFDHPEDIRVLRCEHPDCLKRTCTSCLQAAAAVAAKEQAEAKPHAETQADVQVIERPASECGTCSTLVDDNSADDHHGRGCFGCFSRVRFVPKRVARKVKSIFGKKADAPAVAWHDKLAEKEV